MNKTRYGYRGDKKLIIFEINFRIEIDIVLTFMKPTLQLSYITFVYILYIYIYSRRTVHTVRYHPDITSHQLLNHADSGWLVFD